MRSFSVSLGGFRTSWAALSFCAALACGGAGSGGAGQVLVHKTIGPSGGTVTTPSGEVTIDVPSGALPQGTSISVTGTSAQDGSAGIVYEIGPTGTHFEMPVQLTISYAGVDLGKHSASDLRIATFDGKNWIALADNVVDAASETVSGTTTHLSPYADVFAETTHGGMTNSGGAPNDSGSPGTGSQSGDMTGTGGATGSSGGATASGGSTTDPGSAGSGSNSGGTTGSDGTVNGTGGMTGGGGSGTGGTSGSSGGSSGGTLICQGDGGEGPPGGPYPRCATANPCTFSPNLYVASCMDTATGYMATCCPVQGTGGTSGSGGATGGTTGTGGSSGGSQLCQADASAGPPGGPYPTCATSKPCTFAPNLQVASCTDTATGYMAMCCPLQGGMTASGGTSGTAGTSGIAGTSGGTPAQ